MLKNLISLEHVIEGKVCKFIVDHDTPIHFIKESLFQFQKMIGSIEDAAIAKQKEDEKKNADVTPITEDVVDPPTHRLNEV